MTPFILCEHPEMTAREAIRESKQLMKGNKWRLFCLEISFIGWEVLAAAIFGIVVMLVMTPLIFAEGVAEEAMVIPTLVIFFVVLILFIIALTLTLSPYVMASIAVFYREISEGRYSNPYMEQEAADYSYEPYIEETFGTEE